MIARLRACIHHSGPDRWLPSGYIVITSTKFYFPPYVHLLNMQSACRHASFCSRLLGQVHHPIPYPLKSGIISTNAILIDSSDPYTILWSYRRSRCTGCCIRFGPSFPVDHIDRFIRVPPWYNLQPSSNQHHLRIARDVGSSRTASWMPAQILPLVASPVRLSNNFDILRLGCWLHEADLGSRSLDFELGLVSAIAFQLPRHAWVFTHS